MWARRLLLSCCVSVALALGCRHPSKVRGTERDVAAGIVLGQEWIEIAADPPLQAHGHRPELVLHHSPELTLTREAAATDALYSPRLDQQIRLEVELLARDGSVFRLASGGLSPGRVAMKPADGEVPRDLVVDGLRLRSSVPFAVSKLEWCGSPAR